LNSNKSSTPKASSRKRAAASAERSRAFVKRARALSGPHPAGSNRIGERALQTREQLVQTAVGLFLERGYGGTTIDHIAQAAGMSRASFYTYFPSKREILLAAGQEASTARTVAISALAEIPENWTPRDLKAWLARYLAFLDKYGAFQLVWSQAAWFDEELRAMGVRGSLRTAKIIGAEMKRLGADDANGIDGLAVQSMLERFWYVWKKTRAPFGEEEAIARLARIMQSLLRPPPARQGSRGLFDSDR